LPAADGGSGRSVTRGAAPRVSITAAFMIAPAPERRAGDT